MIRDTETGQILPASAKFIPTDLTGASTFTSKMKAIRSIQSKTS